MRNVGIITKKKNKRALEIGIKLYEWLKERKLYGLCEEELATPLKLPKQSKTEISEQADLIVVLGGDGTLLSIARHINRSDLPILGVNLGGLGFLTAITLDELFKVMTEVLAGNFSLSPRMILKVTLHRKGHPISSHNVLNDVVINKGAMARIIDLKTVIDGKFVNTFKADGLIFSTPTGSTGYSLSAGGPIVYPTLNSITVAPICPHTLSNRPLIVPPEVTIETTLTSTDSDDVFLTLDGQAGFSLQTLDKVTITRACHDIKLVTSPSKPYFEVLRNKLKWGERYRIKGEG
ncbi:MAG: NAD(+)/NADH kinase [Deltaproteobacteria bacterium]|nr:NAD(+)/NADH kinase [Candidatus Tharpella aukensis]